MAIYPADEPFDPRAAALNHAGVTERPAREGTQPTAKQFGQGVTALVCALIYVGDQIQDLNRRMHDGELAAPAGPSEQ